MTADNALLNGMKAARDLAARTLDIMEVKDGKSVRQALNEKAALLCSMDPTFVIEFACLEQLLTADGMKLMENKLLQELPATADQHVPLSVALERVKQVRTSSLYRYSGDKSKSLLDILAETLGSMLQGHQPNVKKLETNAFFAKVVERLPWLTACSWSKLPGGVAKRTVGVAALKWRLEMCREKGAKGQCTLESLNDLHVWDHWLDDGMRAEVKELTEKLIEGMTADKKGSGTGSGAKKRKLGKTKSAAVAKAKAVKKEEEDDEAALDALFT